MIKILMVVGNTGMGGAQAFILNVLRNIDHKKFHIDFAINFFVEQNGIEEECKGYGCKFFIMPAFKVYNYISYRKAWRLFFKDHHYDIVYAHATNAASIFLGEAKKNGIKTIAHSHSAGYRGGRLEQLTKKFFAKGVGKVADYWFSCSDKAAERLYGAAYKNYPHYYCLPNAIDAEKYKFNAEKRSLIREKLNISDETLLCGHVGTFSSPKNHMFLIEIMTEVIKIKPDAKLICCGAGALMETVKARAKDLGILENIIFAGVVKNVEEYMMAMDCFVFPSLFEGFPISILEAQATGLPIVMSDVITEEVDLTMIIKRLSLLQPASEWAKAILLTSTQNREINNEAIANSKFNIKKTVKSFEKLYSKLADK